MIYKNSLDGAIESKTVYGLFISIFTADRPPLMKPHKISVYFKVILEISYKFLSKSSLPTLSYHKLKKTNCHK